MGKQRRHRYNRAAPVHKNPNGQWCHCPFGDPRKEKYVSRHMKEFVGSWENTAGFTVEAAKYDWLLDRPDTKDNPEYASFVHKLQAMYPQYDPLFPWLLREYKKGRITDTFKDQLATHVTDDGYAGSSAEASYLNGSSTPLASFLFQNHYGSQASLNEDHLDQISDWMKYMKQAKKGVDIMKHEIGPALHEAEKNDEGGETVHNFTDDDDGNPYGHYDDWSVKRLRNKRDMVKEGDRMNHCVGSNGMGYLEKNDEGKGAYYSLRTPNNEPVATLEMLPMAEQYYMCPGCKKPAFGRKLPTTRNEDDTYSRSVVCEHCQTQLAKNDPADLYKDVPLEGVKQFPVKINYKKPTADHMEAAQLFGHSDKKLNDDHESLINAWLSRHGHSWVNSDGDEDYEDEQEEESYDPWWDSSYDVDGAETMEDFLKRHVNEDYHDDAPDEYHRAMRDAEEHGHIDGVQEPELYLLDPQIEDIFQDMVDTMAPGVQGQHASQVDPHRIADMFKHMEKKGHGDEWRKLANTWLTDEYNAYLDPYGTAEGPGNFQHHERGIIGPPTPEGKLPQADLTSPGVHYPGKYFPADELFAKNLDYHLDKYRDPQRGHREDRGEANDVSDAYNLRYNYPMRNPGDKQTEPKIPLKEDTPIPDQRGVDIVEPGAFQELEGERPGIRRNQRREHLPYGRGIEFEPAGSGGRSSEPNQPHIPPEAYDQKRPVDAFRPARPGSPEEAFGQEDNRFHQRPLPGIQGFDPMQLEQFPDMQQQGQLMPQHWYRNLQGRLHRAELPPELYPPDLLMYSQPIQNPLADFPDSHQIYSPMAPEQPGQPRGTEPMWQKAPVGQESLVRTQTDVGSEDWGSFGPPRPIAPWVAKTAGPWTEYENEQKNWPEPHTGVPQLNGRVVETNVPSYQELPMFEWRRPVVYHRNEDKLYVGQPSMDHTEMMAHMGKESPWAQGMPRRGMLPGYIDLTSHLGEGGLHFFQSAQGIPNEDQLHDWVEGRFGVRRPEDTQELTDADWISSSRKVAWYGEIPKPGDSNYEEYVQAEKERMAFEEGGPFQWQGPGKADGKAMLDTTGQLHTWDDHGSPSYWTHGSQADMRGVQADYAATIYINQDGDVRDSYGVARSVPEKANRLYEELRKAHPGTTWPAIDANQKGEFDDDALWHDSSYHPRQEDEWAAGDEADFSVVVPEARWAS